ncbi:MAG: TonB-dependent receptor [Desulfobacteraceae bacterium]|nr:TonB-dependent receptor [Desulfobacteraceae bacterium]
MEKKKVVLVLMVVFFLCSGAHGNPVENQTPYQIGEVKVTAQKKEENMQEVPMSLDVFSDLAIKDAGIEKTDDLVRLSPNVHMMDRSCEHIVVIRGISPFRGSTYSPAGFYVDDVSYPMHYMQNIELFDLERAEILKGPQGTLYGRNAESGVINLISRQPDNWFQAKVFSEYGNYNTFRSGINVSGPVVKEKLFLGGAFQYRSSDGFLENESDGNDQVAERRHMGGRATLRWTPVERWEISLIADILDADDHGAEGRAVYGLHATDEHKIRSDCDADLNQGWNSQILRIKYDADAFNVLSVSSMMYQTLDKINDCDLWDNPLDRRVNPMDMKERQYSQEVRVSSSQDGPFSWLVGLYGFMEESDFNYRYDILSAGTTYMNPVTDVDADGYAVFGQGTYTFFDRIHLTAGVRFDHQTMEGDLKDAVRQTAYCKSLSYDEILPKFSLAYDVSKDVMTYTSVSKGYMAGGFNWGTTGTEETFCYDPEYTWNYEAGIKSTWLDDRLMANLSAFFIEIEDKQVSQLHPTIAALTISNAAKAHSKGVEMQVQAKPLPGLDLFAGVGFTESRFKEFSATVKEGNAIVQKDYEDNYLTNAPRYSYNVGVQYRSEEGLFGRADLLGTGRFYGDAANTARQDAYELVNLRLGYEQDNFEVFLWAENVFDQQYFTFTTPFLNSILGIDGRPRTFGVTVTLKL